MNFSYWLMESSLVDLTQSAVDAFPNTTKRQHATQPINIKNLRWTPYQGMKTLLVRSIAESLGKEYNPMILFTGLHYLNEQTRHSIQIIDKYNMQYYIETPSLEKNDVKIRCNCEDFYWRFNYYTHLDKSLYGRKRAPYEAITNRGPVNPTKSEGMCKHLMKLAEVLNLSGLVI